MKKPPGTARARAAVLSLGQNDADGALLENIFQQWPRGMYTADEWTFMGCSTLDSAFTALREAIFPIVICEADLVPGVPGTWRAMLEYISFLSDPPLLIVSSRLADDSLWAETLNLGAYDVLAKPFDTTEVIRIVSSAWQHWEDRHHVHVSRTRQRMAATGT